MRRLNNKNLKTLNKKRRKKNMMSKKKKRKFKNPRKSLLKLKKPENKSENTN